MTEIVIAVLIALYLMSCIKILAEYERGVIFCLGRVLAQPKGPGLILLCRPFEQMVRTSLREWKYRHGTS